MIFVILESNMYLYEINNLQASPRFPGKYGPWRERDIIRFLAPIFGDICALMMQMNVL